MILSNFLGNCNMSCLLMYAMKDFFSINDIKNTVDHLNTQHVEWSNSNEP